MDAVHGPVVLFGCHFIGWKRATGESTNIVGLHRLADGQNEVVDRILSWKSLGVPKLVLENVRNGHSLLARLFSNLHQTSMSLVMTREACRCLEIPEPRPPTEISQIVTGRVISMVARGNKCPVGWGSQNLAWSIALDR